MRITQTMILRNTLKRVNDNRDQMNRIQQHLASQKRVEKPSDDPLSFSRASRYRNALDQNKQFLENIKAADAWAGTTNESLNQFYDYISQAVDIASRGADGSSDADIRASMAITVKGMLDDVINLSNTKYMGKSVFAGTLTNEAEPFELNGNVVTYNGNDDKITRKLARNVSEDINITGQQLVDSGMYTGFLELIAGLESNDVTRIQNSMDTLKQANERISGLSSSIGSLRSNMSLLKGRLTTLNVNLQSYISDEEDTNMENEIVKFKSQETAYQAALQSASEVMQLNILNYLG